VQRNLKFTVGCKSKLYSSKKLILNIKYAIMFTTNSLWFEIAVVSIIYALGNILMGHFEERTPKWRRVSKYVLTLIIVSVVSIYFGRIVAMALLAAFIVPLLYIHGYFLPKKKGINGWTGEPKSKYYDFRKWDKDIFKEK
jgi:sugar phosphate permease